VPFPLHASPPPKPASWRRARLSCFRAALRMWTQGDTGQQAEKECAARDGEREAADNLLLQDAFAQAKADPGNLLRFAIVKCGAEDRSYRICRTPQTGTVDHQPGREVQKAHSVLVTPGSRLSRLVIGVSEEAPGFCQFEPSSSNDRPGQGARSCRYLPGRWRYRSTGERGASAVCCRCAMAPGADLRESGVSRALFAAFS